MAVTAAEALLLSNEDDIRLSADFRYYEQMVDNEIFKQFPKNSTVDVNLYRLEEGPITRLLCKLYMRGGWNFEYTPVIKHPDGSFENSRLRLWA